MVIDHEEFLHWLTTPRATGVAAVHYQTRHGNREGEQGIGFSFVLCVV